MGEIGIPELLLILGIALIVFGGKKIPEISRSLGEGIRGFREAMHGGEDKASGSEEKEKQE